MLLLTYTIHGCAPDYIGELIIIVILLLLSLLLLLLLLLLIVRKTHWYLSLCCPSQRKL